MTFDKDPRLETVVGLFLSPKPTAPQPPNPKNHEQTHRKSSKSKPKTATRRKLGRPMKGCEILVAALERENVDTIFAYPAVPAWRLHQALTQSEKIRTILPRHEQGGSFAAEGYARASGKAGVCMATSGPGATNLVTGIADAWMDSTPLVALTGQVPQAMIGKGAFQETDFYGMTLGVVKHSYLITDIRDIPRVVKEAFTSPKPAVPARWSLISRKTSSNKPPNRCGPPRLICPVTVLTRKRTIWSLTKSSA